MRYIPGWVYNYLMGYRFDRRWGMSVRIRRTSGDRDRGQLGGSILEARFSHYLELYNTPEKAAALITVPIMVRHTKIERLPGRVAFTVTSEPAGGPFGQRKESSGNERLWLLPEWPGRSWVQAVYLAMKHAFPGRDQAHEFICAGRDYGRKANRSMDCWRILSGGVLNNLDDVSEGYLEPTISALVSCFGADEGKIRSYNADNPDSQYYVIKKQCTYDEIAPFQELEADEETGKYIQGVWFEEEYRRSYPFNARLRCDRLRQRRQRGHLRAGGILQQRASTACVR